MSVIFLRGLRLMLDVMRGIHAAYSDVNFEKLKFRLIAKGVGPPK